MIKTLACVVVLLLIAWFIPQEDAAKPTLSSDNTQIESSTDSTACNLKLHEGGKHRGHTLKKHVGHTKEALLARLNREQRIPAASSFFNYDLANGVICEALKAEKKTISTWLKAANDSGKFTIYHRANQVVGQVIKRGSTTAKTTKELKVILVKAPNKTDYKVLTAYPFIR